MSNEDHKVGVTVVANNEAKATFQEIKSDAAAMAGAVEQSGQQAAKGVEAIGDSAENTTQKVSRAQGRITSELIRVTEQTRIAAEAGGSLARAFEIKGSLRGVDMSGLSPMVNELRHAEQALASFKAQQAQSSTQTSFIDSLQSQTESLGKTRVELLELKAAQLGLTTQAAPHIAKLRESESAIGGVGMSARATAAAMAQVPLQFQDIVVSLQGGQAPLTVLLQQGSQLVGTFGGVGAATKALGTYMLSLVTPLTAVAAAVAVLGLAYYQGSKEIDNYRMALILSGNQAGTSVDQLNQMAKAMSGAVGTQGAAAAGLAEMAKNSKVGSDKLQEFTTAAILWQKSTGQAVSETAKQFADLAKDPLKASLALNEQINHLTASVYDQIKALEEQGRTEEAAAAAQQAYSDAMTSRRAELVQNLGYIERAVNTITTGAKQMWDAVLGIGRTAAPTDQFSKNLGKLEAQLSDYKRRAAEDRDPKWQEGIAKLQAQVDAAKALPGMAGSVDTYLATLKTDQKAYVDSMSTYDQLSDQFASKETKRTQALTVERNKYNAAVEATKKSYAGEQELPGKLADLEAKHLLNVEGINKRFTEKGKAGSSKPARDALSIDINATKRDLEVLTFSYTSAQKVMEAQRAAGLVDDKAYYEEKRKYINLEADAQDKLLQAEMDRYKQEKVTKDNRLQVEKGIADTQAKMDKAKMERASALEVLTTQQDAALNAQKASIKAAEQAAQDYLATMQKGFDRTVDAVGWGSERRNVESGKQQIEDRYAGQRRDLENQRAQIEMQTGLELSAQQQELYDSRLAIIKKHESLALEAYGNGVQRRLEAEGNWLIGVDRAYQDYSSSAANVAQQSADLFSNAFKGMEDALTSFVMTGKADFKSLANSIIADIVRTQLRAQSSGVFGSLVNGITGLFGGSPVSAGSSVSTSSILNTGIGFGSLAGGRATGGDVLPRSIYQVNERDVPELASFGGKQYLMTANQPGSVTPLAQASAALSGRAVVSGGSMPSVRVELINKGGQAAEVTNASLGMDANGGLLVRAVIEQAKKAAVQEVAAQTANDYGDMGQAMRQRERMGMR